MTLSGVWSRGVKCLLALAIAWWSVALARAADDAAPAAKAPPAATPPAKPVVSSPSPADKAPAKPAAAKRYRPLAEGAMITIPAQPMPMHTVNRNDMVELLAADPKLEFAKEVPFRREIWALEFKFKPIRIIDVDLPQPSGQMQRKPIWYMLYSVTNTGKALQPVPVKDRTYELKTIDKPVRFIPSFLLEIPQLDKAYRDRVIPLAVAAIQMREDPNRELYNTAEIPRQVKVGETVWGVATWEDIDPKVTHFSILAFGLTNAQQWVDIPGKFQPGDKIGTGRRLIAKALKINFRRPGDEHRVTERQILYGDPDGVDYSWEDR
jgi:hypothetical protein